MKNYVGRKCKGFKFAEEVNEEIIFFTSAMEQYIDKVGVVTEQDEYDVIIDFNGVSWYYPISEIEKHLVDEEKDSIVESVRADLQRRSEIGIKKYNTTLDRTDLTEIDWLNHAYEEALDLALYLKKNNNFKTRKQMRELIKNVIQWANERNLIHEENAIKQYLKVLEEVGETARCIIKDDLEGTIDGFISFFSHALLS